MLYLSLPGDLLEPTYDIKVALTIYTLSHLLNRSSASYEVFGEDIKNTRDSQKVRGQLE